MTDSNELKAVIETDRGHYKRLATLIYLKQGERGLDRFLESIKYPPGGRLEAIRIMAEIRQENPAN